MVRPGNEVRFARRSPAEWGARAVLALGAAWLGYGAMTHSLGNAVRKSSPEQAYRLAPGDAGISAGLASQLSGPNATRQDRARADTLALMALRRDPVSVPALSTLGLNAQIRGETAAARRTFAYVQKLTRRDLRTQLWAIEDAVARNDIPGALDQYDIALRTGRESSGILVPVLVGAIIEPSVRRELVRVLATNPPWGRDFIIHASSASPDPQATVALLNAMQHAGVSIPPPASVRVISALLAHGSAESAWRYYVSMHRDAKRYTSRDPRFTLPQETSTQFDWKPVEGDDLTAAIEADGKGGRFDFATSAGTGGPVLRQMQILPPGEYVIEGMGSVEQTDAPAPYWLLSCAEGRELGRVDLTATGNRFRGEVRVPSDCPVQALTLVVRPSEQMKSVSGQVTEVRVRPVSTRS